MPLCAVVPDTTRSLVLVWLPGIASKTLTLLARVEPLVMNVHSTDLLECRTKLCWATAEGTEVQLDVRRLNGDFLCSKYAKGYDVVFLNESAAFHCEYHLDTEEVQAMILNLKGAMARSGPNYNAVHVWGKDVLRERHGPIVAPDPKIIRPKMLHWSQEKSTSKNEQASGFLRQQ